MLAICVILFISWVFMFDFIPEAHPELTTSRILLSTFFGWFSVNTIWSILAVLTSDPGYIDSKYKQPLNSDGSVDEGKMRVLNKKHFKRNFLYDFSGHVDTENRTLDTSVDADSLQEDIPDSQIEQMTPQDWHKIE